MPCWPRRFLITHDHATDGRYRWLYLSGDMGTRGRLDAVCREHALNVEIVAEIDGGVVGTPACATVLARHIAAWRFLIWITTRRSVIGVRQSHSSRPNFLVSLSDDERPPTLAAQSSPYQSYASVSHGAGEWRAQPFTLTKKPCLALPDSAPLIYPYTFQLQI